MSTVPWPQENGNFAAYQLHCHCGAVRLNMKLSPPLYKEQTTDEHPERWTAVECDCSHCQRKGMICVHPLAKDVKFTKGLDVRGEYLMKNGKNPHWFCTKCGSTIGTDLTYLMENVFKQEPRYTINIRNIKDFDRERLLVKPAVGMKAMGEPYTVGDEE